MLLRMISLLITMKLILKIETPSLNARMVPQSACLTEGMGSKAIRAMTKYTTCDKLTHRNISCLKAFFYLLKLVILV